MRQAIVFGENYGTLGVVSSLSKEGIQVILLASEPGHAWHSRFVSKRVRIPDPVDHSSRLLELLMKTKENWDGALLLPTSDEYVNFVSQNRTELNKRYISAVQDWKVIREIIKKNMLYLQAQKMGVPTPQFYLPDSVQFLHQRRNDFFYPCILKPFDTRQFHRVYKKKVFVIRDFRELIDQFSDIQQNQLQAMISEIIPGEDSSLFHYRSYIDSLGDVLAEMCTQKLRQYPSGFGQAAVARTIPIIPEIRHFALTLLRSFSYRGESSAEFKLDHRDNQYKLMEINVRPVTPEGHFFAAGINFAYMTYLDLIENIRKPSSTYRHDIYWINNFWDIQNFFGSLRSGNLHLREFLRPYWKKKVFAVPFFDDPIHFLIETSFAGGRAFKKLKKW